MGTDHGSTLPTIYCTKAARLIVQFSKRGNLGATQQRIIQPKMLIVPSFKKSYDRAMRYS